MRQLAVMYAKINILLILSIAVVAVLSYNSLKPIDLSPSLFLNGLSYYCSEASCRKVLLMTPSTKMTRHKNSEIIIALVVTKNSVKRYLLPLNHNSITTLSVAEN